MSPAPEEWAFLRARALGGYVAPRGQPVDAVSLLSLAWQEWK